MEKKLNRKFAAEVSKGLLWRVIPIFTGTGTTMLKEIIKLVPKKLLNNNEVIVL